LFDLIMFDLDGTLVDSRKDVAFALNLALEEMGVPTKEPEEIYPKIGGGMHNLLRGTLPPTRDDLVECGVDLFWDFYKDHILDSTVTYPGVYRMLEELGGRKLAVVTNKPYNHTHKVLIGLDMDRYFLSVQGWKTGLNVKPAPDLLLRAMEDAEASPESTLMVGDSMADIMSARQAGVRVCSVGYGYGNPDRLKEAGPDYFAGSVGDIKGIID